MRAPPRAHAESPCPRAHPQERPLLADPPQLAARRGACWAWACRARTRRTKSSRSSSSASCSTTSSSPTTPSSSCASWPTSRPASAASCSPATARFSTPYEQARRELEGVLAEAQDVAENGMEDERVAAFDRLVHDWIRNVSEPQIHAREKGQIDRPRRWPTRARRAPTRCAASCADLRRHALDDADDAPASGVRVGGRLAAGDAHACCSSRSSSRSGSGAWIARDIAGTTGADRGGPRGDRAASRRIPALPAAPRRARAPSRAASAKMNALLLDKDASLRATLAERERALGRADARQRGRSRCATRAPAPTRSSCASSRRSTSGRSPPAACSRSCAWPTPRWASSTCSTTPTASCPCRPRRPTGARSTTRPSGPRACPRA